MNEFRILGVQLQQFVLERRQLEEVIFFRDRFRRPSALGTWRAGADGIHVKFVKDAILAGVFALVDEAVLAAARGTDAARPACADRQWCG